MNERMNESSNASTVVQRLQERFLDITGGLLFCVPVCVCVSLLIVSETEDTIGETIGPILCPCGLSTVLLNQEKTRQLGFVCGFQDGSINDITLQYWLQPFRRVTSIYQPIVHSFILLSVEFLSMISKMMMIECIRFID